MWFNRPSSSADPSMSFPIKSNREWRSVVEHVARSSKVVSVPEIPARRLYVSHSSRKNAHWDSDDSMSIWGRSGFLTEGLYWCVASGATGGTCFEAWQFSKAAAIVAPTSSVVYSQPSIGHLMAGMVLRPRRSRYMLAHLHTLPVLSLTQAVVCVGENGELTVQNAKQHMQGNSVSTCELHDDIMRYGLSKMPVNPLWIGLDGVCQLGRQSSVHCVSNDYILPNLCVAHITTVRQRHIQGDDTHHHLRRRNN